MVKIFIDPGHGGSDPGAVGFGLQEKNLTLDIANRVRDILMSEYENVSIKMSRMSDVFVSLSSRTNAANKWGADFYLSIHINSGGGTGFETYRYSDVGRPTSTYQEKIHEKTLEQVDFKNRGIKQASFHVLRETKMPAVLTENGFIDHSDDTNKLKDSSFIESIAIGHANGIASAFGLTRKPVSAVNSTVPTINNLFKVQIGAYRDEINAEQLANKAKAKGFQIYLAHEDTLFKVQIGAFSNRVNAEEMVKRAKKAGFDASIIIN